MRDDVYLKNRGAEYRRPDLVCSPRDVQADAAGQDVDSMDCFTPSVFSPSALSRRKATIEPEPEEASSPPPIKPVAAEAKDTPSLLAELEPAKVEEEVAPVQDTLSPPLDDDPVESDSGHTTSSVDKTPQVNEGNDSKPEEPKASALSLGAAKWRPKALYVVAGFITIAGLAAALQLIGGGQDIDRQANMSAKQSGSEGELASYADKNNLPIDEKPADKDFVKNHKVVAGLPRTITIPSQNIYARVLEVGMDKSGKIKAPMTSYDTAWYSGSSRPGETGAMVINGYSMTRASGKGVFGDLKSLAIGSQIIVEKGDGSKITFVVKKSETVEGSRVDMVKILASYDTDKPGLNVITSSSKHLANQNTVDERTVVYAVQQ